jgi:hypothetical protein
MKRVVCILVFALTLLLVACSTNELPPSVDTVAVVTREKAEQIKYDMSYEDVLELLGPTLEQTQSQAIVQEYELDDQSHFCITYLPDTNGVLRVLSAEITRFVTRESAEQVEYGMSKDEVLELLGATKEIGSGTFSHVYLLPDGDIASFGYNIDVKGTFRVSHIYIGEPPSE